MGLGVGESRAVALRREICELSSQMTSETEKNQDVENQNIDSSQQGYPGPGTAE